MFTLTPDDLAGSILDCGGGPASFTAEATADGFRAVACDPLYQFSASEIRRRVGECFAGLVENMRVCRDRFVWDESKRSPEHVGEIRMRAMERFLADYPQGRRDGRYVAGELPYLPFRNDTFRLALSSHFLFLYSAQLSAEFHLFAIRELMRVSAELRIFPLLDMDGQPSAHVGPVCAQLAPESYIARLCRVPYEFQKNGHTMLVVKRAGNAAGLSR